MAGSKTGTTERSMNIKAIDKDGPEMDSREKEKHIHNRFMTMAVGGGLEGLKL